MVVVVGLGGIGGNMGLRLADRRWPVVGLDVSAERAAKWSNESGCPAYASSADVDWTSADQVLLAVRTHDQVEAVLDILEEQLGDRAVSLIIVSTLSVTAAAGLSEGRPASWRFIEAPVSGGEHPAREGTLSMFVYAAGATADDDAVLDLLSGQRYDFAEAGQPAVVKLLNNTLAAYNADGLAHAIAVAGERGVAREAFVDMIAHSSGKSFVADHYFQLSQNQLALLEKDVRLLGEDGLGSGLLAPLEGFFDRVLDARGNAAGADSVV